MLLLLSSYYYESPFDAPIKQEVECSFDPDDLLTSPGEEWKAYRATQGEGPRVSGRGPGVLRSPIRIRTTRKITGK